MMAVRDMLDAALTYAERGMPVFPCNPKNKRPYLSRDRDGAGSPIKGSGGVRKATTDPELIRSWWAKWPTAMIGVAVGRADMIVIDFDPRRDEIVDGATGEVLVEEWTLERLKVELEAQIGCELPTTLAARTPSGGVHLYYRMPAGDPIGNRGNLPKHVDVRGLGGYVIAPPSVYVGDDSEAPRIYRWLRGDETTPVAPPPGALVDVLRASPARERSRAAAPVRSQGRGDDRRFTVDIDEAHRRYAYRALDDEVTELARTPRGGGRHGGRNAGAYAAAFNLGQFVGAGALSETIVRQSLLEVVRGFDAAAYDAHATAIENGIENGRAKPRDLTSVGSATRSSPARRSDDALRATSSHRPTPPLAAYGDDASSSAPRHTPSRGTTV